MTERSVNVADWPCTWLFLYKLVAMYHRRIDAISSVYNKIIIHLLNYKRVIVRFVIWIRYFTNATHMQQYTLTKSYHFRLACTTQSKRLNIINQQRAEQRAPSTFCVIVSECVGCFWCIYSMKYEYNINNCSICRQ